MPRQDEDELEANVEFEANKLIPENLENVNLDYQVLGYLEAETKWKCCSWRSRDRSWFRGCHRNRAHGDNVMLFCNGKHV